MIGSVTLINAGYSYLPNSYIKDVYIVCSSVYVLLNKYLAYIYFYILLCFGLISYKLIK